MSQQHPNASNALHPTALIVLRAVEFAQCDYVANLAFDTMLPKSTIRRWCERLEDLGLVEGFKKDERDLFPNGRIRVYWNVTEAGVAKLAENPEDVAHG